MLRVLRGRAFGLAGRIERRAAAFQGKGARAAMGSHAKEVAAALRILGRPPALAIDIGGNTGNWTIALQAAAPGACVHLFEPAATNLAKLRDRFRTDGAVTIVPAAVAAANGVATLFANTPGSGLSSLTRRRLNHFGIAFDHEEQVSTLRFEDYWRTTLASTTIDLCKLDIEGHELDALAGFGAALSSVRVFQFEFGGCNIDTRTFFQDFWYLFQEHNFSIFRLTPFGAHPIARYSESEEFFSFTNYIAKRNW